jgi:hypothetical protein
MPRILGSLWVPFTDHDIHSIGLVYLHMLFQQGRATFYYYTYYVGSDKLIQGRANDVFYKVSNSIDWVDNNSFRIYYERVG